MAVLVQAASGPPATLHRWTESDMHFFDTWAQALAAGDWLTDRALHPTHGWHREAVEQHLDDHPDEALEWGRRAEAAGGGRDGPALLLDAWWGGKRFHQEPLYPYLLAVIALVSGGGALAVFVMQALAGLLTVALVHRVARQAFGDGPAAWAGLLAVFCGPLLFYEVVLLRASLMACATMALLALAQRACVSPSRGRLFALGLLGGVATLLKTTFAPFVLLAGAWLLWRRRGGRAAPDAPPRDRAAGVSGLARALCLAAGFALALLPTVARNVAVGAPPLSLQSVGPMTFVAFNSPRAGTDLTGFFPSTADIAEIFGETGGEGWPSVRATVARLGGWGALVPRVVQRAGHLLHAHESPQNVNLAFFRELVPALRWAPAGFGVVAPLALVGGWLAWRRRRGALLVLMAVSAVAPLLLFSTLARYRLPLLVTLLPFAGLLLSAATCWVRARAVRPLALAALVVAGAALLVNRPLPEFAPVIRVDDHVQVFEADFRPRLLAASQAQDWAAALAVAEELLALEPPELAALDGQHPPRSAHEAALARHFAMLHRLTADISLQAGDELRAGAALVREGALRAALRDG